MARRAEASITLTSIILSLLLIFAYSGGVQSTGEEQVQSKAEQKTWCVAKPSSDDDTLNANLNYACSQVDCTILQKDCANPNKLISHASIAMNLYYQAMGRNYWNCFFGNSALVVTTDPSYDHCPYA